MQRVVGYGLIVLAAGYVLWLAFSGTPFGRGETVVINSGGDSNANGAVGEANSAHELELNIVTLLGFDGIPSIENPRFVEPEIADETYDPEELVLSLGFDTDPVSFPHSKLRSEKLVHTSHSGTPTIVYFDPATDTALAFGAVVNG